MRLSRISKSFGANRAVDDVSLDITPGEVLAVVGENGAGKTTLMRIAAGELAPDAGRVLPSAPVIPSEVEGSRASRRGADPSTALGRTSGVGFVHQHFLLVPELTVAENLALIDARHRFATRRTLEREAERIIGETGIALGGVSRRVHELSVAEKSKLELIKAIARKPSTLILDEPTSVLTPHESEELFRVMRALAASGTAIVFISHKLPEVLAVAQRVAVMRAGKLVLETRSATAAELAAAMTALHVRRAAARPRDGLQPVTTFRHGDLELRRSEIVAIVGVAGNGQGQLARELRERLPDAAHIPEDRTRDGVIAQMSIAENLALRDVDDAAELIALYNVRARGAQQLAGDLSGGNQQKVILARELARNPEVIVAAEPTRGLDLDATAFIRDRLRGAAADGAAVLLITSDLDEAFALADALHVIYRGRLSARMTPEEASSRVAALMAGVA